MSHFILSLKRNIVSSYFSNIYTASISILVLPLYIQNMGAEAYGLVGFFTMLQAWFALLDMGLTPTIARESARYHGGAMSALAYRQLFRALSLIFACIAVIGGGGLWLLSEVVATRWLNVSELQMDEVVLAVQIMAVSVALRWMGGLYRGVVTGSERLVWLSGFNALIATLRFIAVLPSMWLLGFTPLVFFGHQLVVALLEVLGLLLMSLRLLPAHNMLEVPIGWSFSSVRPLLRFSLTIAFTSSVWVLVTQTDKLVLSGILPLAEYGYYTLAVLVASGVMVISAPISSAIMPRMARLYAEGKKTELIRVYRDFTQITTIIAGAVAITLAFSAEPLLFAWTGDQFLTRQAAPILVLYVVGNGILAVAAFPYYLQYAKGDLHYHFIGSFGMGLLLVPCIVVASSSYGGVGAGYVWSAMNFLYLLLWVAYVHGKIEPGLHLSWLLNDVLKIVLPAAMVAFFIWSIGFDMGSRVEGLLYAIAMGGCVVSGAAVFSKVAKSMLRRVVFKVF